MSKHSIIKVINDQKTMQDIVSAGIDRELKRQKAAGKKFISDEAINNLVDTIIKEELGEAYKENY